MGAIMKNGIPYGGDSGTSGHTIINSGGSAVNERSNLKFAGYTKLSDDAANDTTIVSNDPTPITYANWQLLTTQEKEGTYWLITGGPTGNFLAYGSDVIGGGGGGAAEGRVLSFNTLISDDPITIPDTDLTDITEDLKLQKSTTILSAKLPMEKAGQVFTETEIAVKCNISPDNLQGNVRFEVLYVLNGEVDREIRPHSIQNFTIQTENEWNIIRLFYLTPELNIGDNVLAVKLLCTGGVAEIGISAENSDYGDALIVCTSEGLPIGQVIDDVRPVSMTLTGKDEYTYLDEIHLADFNVTCQYSNGDTYDITNLVTFDPIMDTIVGNDDFTLTASYMGLTSELPIIVNKIDHLEIENTAGLVHGETTIAREDITVKAILQNGDEMIVTDDCIFDPVIGTTISEETVLSASYSPLWTEDNPQLALFTYEMATVVETLTGGASPNDIITYTLYEDDYIRITGALEEVGNSSTGYTCPTLQLPAFTTIPEEYILEFALNSYSRGVKVLFPILTQNGNQVGKIKKIVNNSKYPNNYSSDFKITTISQRIDFRNQNLLTSEDLSKIFNIQYVDCYERKQYKQLDLSYAFEGCTSLTDLSFFASYYVNLRYFAGTCTMKGMFQNCSNLTAISFTRFNVDVNAQYSATTTIDASSLFENCDKLRNISNFTLSYNKAMMTYFTNVANMFARSYEAYQEDPTFENTHILDADQLNWQIPDNWTKATLGIKTGTGLSNQIGFLFGTDIPQSETSLANKEYPLPQWYATLCGYSE